MAHKPDTNPLKYLVIDYENNQVIWESDNYPNALSNAAVKHRELNRAMLVVKCEAKVTSKLSPVVQDIV